ncbi:MAG: cation diffusion facilitator family transporter [Georgfuchsia sp.]
MNDEHAQFHHAQTSNDERSAVGRRITWVSVAVNIVLTAMQMVIGYIAHSQSLMADAMHTLADVVSDGFVLFAIRSGSKAADADHPYGHGRVETAASLVLGLVLFATGAGILLSAASRLQNMGNVPPVGIAAMWAAMATLVGKELLFRYMLRAAQRLRSPMLVANAWHARADALSSLVVAAGVGGALAGFPFADALAAIVVGVMIIKSGLGFAWNAILELIDTSLSEDEVNGIRASIESTPGVCGLHDLRTRRMAHQALVDAHIRVSPRISVSEGHYIAESARQGVLRNHPEVLDVLVHIDAEDDFDPSHSGGKLPGREELMGRLELILGEDIAQFEKVILHYLGQQVEAEVFLPDRIVNDPECLDKLETCLAERLPKDDWFSSITLNYKAAPR